MQVKTFWGFAICMASSNSMFYAFVAGAPLVSVAVLDMRTPELGFYMGTITAGFMLGSYLSGRYSGRFTLTTMMIAGRAIACAGLVAGAFLVLSGSTSVLSLFGATIFAGFGNGLTIKVAMRAYDCVFMLHSRFTGMEAALLPVVIAKARVIDTLPVAAVPAYRRRGKIADRRRSRRRPERGFTSETPEAGREPPEG